MAWHNRIFGGLFGANGHAKTKAVPRRERSIGKPQTTQSARNTPRANSWPELAVEIEKDPAFQLGSLAIKALIQTTEVAIEGAGEDQRAVALAENLKTRWYDILPHLLSSFGNGYAAAEFWYEHNREKSILEIAEIKPLPALQVRPVVPDGADNVEGIEIVGEEKDGPLDPETTIWFALDQYRDPKGWRPWGISRYAWGGVEIWQARLELATQRKQFVRRFALGPMVLYAPDEKPEGTGIATNGPLGQVDDTAKPIDPKWEAATSLMQTQSGGVIAFSSQSYPTDQGGGPLYRVDQIPVNHQTGPIDSEETRSREDALSVIGIPPKSLYQESVGAFASVTAFQRIMYASTLGFLDQLVTCYQTVIDRAWAMNYSTPCPLRATYQSLDPEVLYRIIEIAKAMVLSGQVSPLITEGVLDFPKMLDQAGIPVGDNLQARLEAVKAASVPPPQPGAMFRLRSRRRRLNCGTGSDGFKPGNKCGGERKGVSKRLNKSVDGWNAKAGKNVSESEAESMIADMERAINVDVAVKEKELEKIGARLETESDAAWTKLDKIESTLDFDGDKPKFKSAKQRDAYVAASDNYRAKKKEVDDFEAAHQGYDPYAPIDYDNLIEQEEDDDGNVTFKVLPIPEEDVVPRSDPFERWRKKDAGLEQPARRRLAKPDPVKSLPVDWEKIGEEHAAEYAPILKQIYEILDREPATIDADTRRHL